MKGRFRRGSRMFKTLRKPYKGYWILDEKNGSLLIINYKTMRNFDFKKRIEVVDVGKMAFSDVQLFLHSDFSSYNVMTFLFFSNDIDCDFVHLVTYLKGWFSAYIIQQSGDNFLKVTFVTKVDPSSFVKRLDKLTFRKGGISYV